uniref:Uncharacterized protein n=1 Tax=Avena sativa TaxID=4498 RepID=A0ACD5TTZ6_AVESA
MWHPSGMIVPSSHTILPLAAGAGATLSGVLLHRRPSHSGGRHLSWARLAASNASSLGEFIRTENQQPDCKLRVDKYYEAEMTVQDCDLDKYGVVNNAIYASYIEKAREELLVGLGISTGWVLSTGNAMALSELNLKYFTPLRRGQKFVVKVRLVRIKGVRIYAEHLIETLPDRKLVLDATATIVCLNMDYRPTRVFPEMSAKLQRFFSS